MLPNEKQLVRLHVACCLAHLTCAILAAFVVFESASTAGAKRDLRVKGFLNLWIQANNATTANALPQWETVEKLVGDDAFHAQNATVCSVEIASADYDEQFKGCKDHNFWACTDGGLPPPTILSLRSNSFALTIPGGYKLLFVLYFLASAAQHLYVLLYRSCAVAALDATVGATLGSKPERSHIGTGYVKWLQVNYRWGPRWVEYAVSASLMSVIITLLTKDAEPDDLVHVSVITSVTMLLGFVCEQCDAAHHQLQSLLLDETIGSAKNQERFDTETINMRPVHMAEVIPTRMTTLINRKSARLLYETTAVLQPSSINALGGIITDTNSQTLVERSAYNMRWLAIGCFYAAFAVQLLGLWSVSWIWRFLAGMGANQDVDDKMFPGNLCSSGPPSWVMYAIYGTVLLYTCFGFVMAYRLFGDHSPGTRSGFANRVIVAEKWYCILSLASKLTLAAIFLFGITQRADCDILPDY